MWGGRGPRFLFFVFFGGGGGGGGGKQTQGIKQKAWGGQGCAEQPRVFPEHGERRGGGGGVRSVPVFVFVAVSEPDALIDVCL